MKRLVVLVVVALTVVLFVSACGGDEEETTPAPAADVQEAPPEPEAAEAPAATAAPTATTAPAAEAAEPAEEEVLSLDDRTSGLEDLKSYRLTWRSEWTAEGATEPAFTWEWQQAVVKDPPASHLMWRTASATEDASLSEIWRIGDTTYMRIGQDPESAQCLALTQQDSQDDDTFNPTTLGGLSDAKFVGREDVNGIPARKYAYDKLGFALFGADDLTGLVWVADDGGYIVKEELSWQGGAGPFASLATTEDAKGAGKWTWELSDVNRPITIAPPEDCVSGADLGIPVMSDAAMQMQSPMGMNYTTPSPVEAVKKFYQEEMPKAGWKAEGEPMDFGAEMAQLAYTKDGKTAQIMITADSDSGGSAVIIVVGE
jgi:hypothetical protein